MAKQEEVSRRQYLKYAAMGAGGLVVGALGGYYSGLAVQGPPPTVTPGVTVTTVTPSAPTLKIGVMTGLTGATASSGIDQQRAAELAVEEINASGGIYGSGISGMKLEVVSRDDASTPEQAVSATNKLIFEDNVDVITACYGSGITLAVMDQICEAIRSGGNKVKIWINAGDGADSVWQKAATDTEKYKYLFQCYYNSKMNGATPADFVANFLAPQYGLKKIAIVGETAAWVDSAIAAAKETLSAAKLDVSLEFRPAYAATDYSSELTAIKAAGIQVILNFISTDVGPALLKQKVEMGVPAILVGNNDVAARIEYWDEVKGSCNLVDIEMWSVVRAPITKKTIPFADKFKAKYGTDPTAFGYFQYDAIYVLKEAIEAAGPAWENPDELVKAMERVDYVGTVGRHAFRSPVHERVFGATYYQNLMTQWQDKEIIVVWPYGVRTGEFVLPPELK